MRDEKTLLQVLDVRKTEDGFKYYIDFNCGPGFVEDGSVNEIIDLDCVSETNYGTQ